MVLHTDQKHPHVHLVVKAESEEGKRLYIRKATLREWRRDFAHCMREQDVAHLGEQVGWGIEVRPIESFEQP